VGALPGHPLARLLAGFVLLGARQMLDSMADTTTRITRAAEDNDRDANAERLLRTLVGRLEIGTTGGREFSGAAREARFTSWCDMPAGWLERCQVTIAFDSLEDGIALTATLSGNHPIVLRRGAKSAALRYLNRPDAGGVWFYAWGRGITAPLALGIIMDSDTIIVRIGERG